jgi:hypothetical protein
MVACTRADRVGHLGGTGGSSRGGGTGRT